MKILTTSVRILVGGLFVFSGFIKFNDPIGFSYKMEEYFEVFADDLDIKQDSLYIKIHDERGNEVEQRFPVYKNNTQRTVWITSKADPELLELGEDSFIVSNVAISVENEVIFDENYLYKPQNPETDSLWISWALGDNPTNHYTEHITPLINLENNITLDYSENIKSQPLLSRFFTALIPFALWIGMFICIFELVLGFALLIGRKPLPVILTMLLMIIFFTFLTGYSAVYNKVTDCGCFGDAIKLTPWESFWKDIILLILILILFIKHKLIKPLFSPGFSYKSVVFITLLSAAYSIYALIYLPPINFLNFADGNNLYQRTLVPEGEPKQDVMEIRYYYQKDGVIEEFDVNTAPVGDDAWEFIDRKEKIIQKAYKPALDNFRDIMHPELGDVSETILTNEGYQLIIASYDVTKTKQSEIKKAIELANKWVKETDYNVWFITSSNKDELDKLAATTPVDFRFCTADNKFVKSIIRSNPGVVLLKGSTVVKNWDSRSIPSFKRIKKRLK